MSEVETLNAKLKNTPYFVMQGKRALKYFRRYQFCTGNDGYRVSKSEVVPYL
jgi:hypothetical protein